MRARQAKADIRQKGQLRRAQFRNTLAPGGHEPAQKDEQGNRRGGAGENAK